MAIGDVTRRQMVNIPKAIAVAGVSRRTIYNWMDNGEIEWTRHPVAPGRLIYLDSLQARAYRNEQAKQMFEPGKGSEQCRYVDPQTKACCLLVRFHDASIKPTPHLLAPVASFHAKLGPVEK